MAVRRVFSREDLDKAGKRSVSAAVEKLEKDIGAWAKDVDLVCRYFSLHSGHQKNLHVFSCSTAFATRYVGVDGVYDLSVRPKRRSQVQFEWNIKVRSYDERFEETVRCDNACVRGVAFPEHWKTALRCMGLTKKADEATAAARSMSENEHVDCKLLGLPKPVTVPIAGTFGMSGSVVALQTATGMRQDHLLVSQYDADRWFCHKGSLDGRGVLDDDDPFATNDLVLKDILRDAFEPDNGPRRRIGPHTTGATLLHAARTRQHSWSRAVAVAIWRAEQLRGAHRPFDKAAGYSGFEANPFKWKFVDGWLSHAEVYFEWAWWADGAWLREFVDVAAHHLTVHGRSVPTPAALLSDDEVQLAKLEEAASEGPTPCEYLGKKMGNSFEKDPSKWQSGRTWKSYTLVFYEWKHVYRGDAKVPHRVSVRANNAVRQGRPQDPLTNSAPKDLYFTVEFMQAFLERKWPGTTYTGVSYESDRPDFVVDVPDGGLNIQDTPVFWTLPCGRTICNSLMEFKVLTEDQLRLGCTDEAYKAVGRALEWDILGKAQDEASLTQLREEPGCLTERRWEALSWLMPEKETDPCWWVVNAADEDRLKPPSFLSRSLACLRLELNQTRCATSAKLRQCYEKRADDNAKVVGVLHNHIHLWKHVAGPEAESLFRPSADQLAKCRQAVERLGELKAREENRDGLHEFAEEIINAIPLLNSLEWEDIRVERCRAFLTIMPPQSHFSGASI